MQDDKQNFKNSEDHFVRVCLNHAFKRREDLPPLMLGAAPSLLSFSEEETKMKKRKANKLPANNLMFTAPLMLGVIPNSEEVRSPTEPQVDSSDVEDKLILKNANIKNFRSNFSKNMFNNSIKDDSDEDS